MKCKEVRYLILSSAWCSGYECKVMMFREEEARIGRGWERGGLGFQQTLHCCDLMRPRFLLDSAMHLRAERDSDLLQMSSKPLISSFLVATAVPRFNSVSHSILATDATLALGSSRAFKTPSNHPFRSTSIIDRFRLSSHTAQTIPQPQ